jgi:hypothetical protein
MIEINAVGVFLFSLLKEGNNRDDILNQFKWTYGLSDLQAKRDFNTFIEKLKEAGILDHAVSLY